MMDEPAFLAGSLPRDLRRESGRAGVLSGDCEGELVVPRCDEFYRIGARAELCERACCSAVCAVWTAGSDQDVRYADLVGSDAGTAPRNKSPLVPVCVNS